MKLFRTAAPAPAARNLAKTTVQIAIVWAFALGVLPALISRAEPRRWRPRRLAGFGLLGAGSGVGLWAAWVMATEGEGTPVPFDSARRLVVRGPYRHVRNPMALSACVQLLGVALLRGSPGTVALAGASAFGWHTVIRPPEERDLLRRFGADYERYRREVRCWIPS